MVCQILWVTFLPSKKISLVFDVAHTTSCCSGEEGGLGKYVFVCVCVFSKWINIYSRKSKYSVARRVYFMYEGLVCVFKVHTLSVCYKEDSYPPLLSSCCSIHVNDLVFCTFLFIPFSEVLKIMYVTLTISVNFKMCSTLQIVHDGWVFI